MANRDGYGVKQLLGKMRNPDADFRFMALNDLINECNRTNDGFAADEPTEKQTVDLVLEMVNDKNTEVKNQAVKTLGVLVKKVSDPRMTTIVDKLVAYAGSNDDQLRDLAGLSLKTVIAEIPPTSKLSPTLCNKLAPKLLSQLGEPSSSPDAVIAALDALSDLLTRFEAQFRANASIQSQTLSTVVPRLTSPRLAISKRAVTALGSLCSSGGDEVFNHLFNKTIIPGLRSTDPVKLKPIVLLIGTLARATPGRLARRVPDVFQPVLATANASDEELRETALQTLEQLLLKCPAEISAFIPAIVDSAAAAIKFDPNYTADDDEDEKMDAGDDVEDEDEDADEDYGDEYSDDDDVSWKIRRAATKLLATLISTRSELLGELYKTVGPVLVSRFAEREESVRIEVWSTYTILLKQTRVYSVASTSRPADISLKRKRKSTADQAAEGPLALLRAQAPAATKSIIKLLNSKSVQVRHAGFVLLHELAAVLGGGLEAQIPALVARVEVALKSSDSGISGTATNLKIEVFDFLALFFATHHPRSFASELPKLVSLLVTGTQDKFHRIASEAFVAASALVKALRPLTPASPTTSNASPSIKSIYDATLERLQSSSADQEVKERAIACLGDLLSHAGDQLETDFDSSLPILNSRLENEVTRYGTVKVVSRVARTSIAKDGQLERWSQETTPTIASFLRKNNRALKIATFDCLDALIHRGATSLTPETCSNVVTELHPLINVSDLQLLPLAINTLAAVLLASPTLSEQTRRDIVKPALQIIGSPLVQGPALESLIALFTALTESDVAPLATIQSLTAIVPTTGDIESIKGVGGGGLQPYFTAARCIGAVVAAAPKAGPDVISGFIQPLQSSKSSNALIFFSLLGLGESGRVVDLSGQPAIFEKALQYFSSPSEDIRTAAAFAAGNIAAGSPATFLGPIVALIQGDEKKRYLSLQALKEVIVHTPPKTLAGFADQLWQPLFDNCETQAEAARNVAAECLGKLTLSDAAKFLPQLQLRLESSSPRGRVTCMAAIRFTLTEDSPTYDEQVSPFLPQFLAHMRDDDLSVRAISLSALNSAAHNKPAILRDALPTLLPYLYEQTVVDESLVRFVEMGPFKHRVDDGLETRKLAYSTMLTLLDTCLSKIDVNEYLGRVLAGITDEDEIKVLCYLMFIRLSHIASTAVASRLDQAADAFSQTLSVKLKDDAVKQDRERVNELQRSALRALAALNRLASPATSPRFSQLLRDAGQHPSWAGEFKDMLAREQSSRSFGSSYTGATAMDIDG